MKINTCVSLALVAAGSVLAGVAAQPDAVRILSSAPLRFEPAPEGRGGFVSRSLHFRSWFTGNKAMLESGDEIVRLRFEGAAPQARVEGIDPLGSTTNIFRGKDAAQWRTSVPNFGRLQVHGLYRGVDLVYYGTAGELEYDLVIQPGANPAQIRMRLDGRLKSPTAYQVAANGARIPVESRYRKNADGSYGFSLGAYDRKRELVIDPVLTFSTYLSGSSQDVANAIGHDAQGFLYVAGTTFSTDFPLAGNSNQAALTGSSDLFLVKIDPQGARVVYSTYFGGTKAETLGAMLVAPSGKVYLTGNTQSTDFPLANAFQTTLSGPSDAFVLTLDPSKNGTDGLLYSTFVGGTGDDFGNGIAVDSMGKIFIAGTTTSNDFPLLSPFQGGSGGGGQDAFVVGVDPSRADANSLIYSTYLGGSGIDTASSIAAAPDGTFWVAGGTFSPDFPSAGFAYQPQYTPSGDAFLTQLNPALGGSSLLYVTFLGGSNDDAAKKVIVDAAGRVIVTGYTTSPDFPVTPDAMQSQFGGASDVFVTILNPAASTSSRSAQLVYATYFGGAGVEIPYDLRQDSAGFLYLTGYTESFNLPVTPNALQASRLGGPDVFALKFKPSQAGPSAIGYSSFLSSDGAQVGYGIDFDTNGNIYLAGYTSGPIFDAIGGMRKTSDAGNTDAFVVGFSPCVFDTSLHSQQFPTQGGSNTITISASPDCAWTASSNLDWVTVSPASGTGNGAVTITVAPNSTGASRQGTINIATIAFLVGQDQ